MPSNRFLRLLSGRRDRPVQEDGTASQSNVAVAEEPSSQERAPCPPTVPAPAQPVLPSARPYSDPNMRGYPKPPLASTPSHRHSSSSEAGPDALAALHPEAILERYPDIGSVQRALARAGLESSNLIFAVDFTSSNTESGRYSFGGRSLHSVSGSQPNPYEQAIQIIGNTLSPFDNDNLIPCYGFGDSRTEAFAVFSFTEGERPLDGFEQVLARYRQMAPHVKLAGPTSFAPAIQQAMKIVMQSNCEYHILIIIADGQVTRGSDTADNELSIYEEMTIEAINEASNLPLSIIMVGVGDGPWEMMEEFDQRLPKRKFDNFRFVNFTSLMTATRGASPSQREAAFALSALQEIPSQYTYIRQNNMLNIEDRDWGFLPTALPPPAVPHTNLGPGLSFERPAYKHNGGMGHYPALPQNPHLAQPPAARYPPAVAPGPGTGASWYPVPPAATHVGHPGLAPMPAYPTDDGDQLARRLHEISVGPAAPPLQQDPPATSPGPRAVTGAGIWSVPLSSIEQQPGSLAKDATRAPWQDSVKSAASKRPPTPPSPPRDNARPPSAGVPNMGAGLDDDDDDEDPDMPREFICPITQMVMQNPATARDGHTYEEDVIKDWLAKKLTSPVTGAELEDGLLIPNYPMRSMIQDYKDKREKQKKERQQQEQQQAQVPAPAASVLL